jgi:hypothetical protein
MEEKFLFLIIGAAIGFIISLLKDLIFNYIKDEKEKKDLAQKRLEELFTIFALISDRARATLINLKTQEPIIYNNEQVARFSFILRVHFPHIHEKYYNDYLNISSEYIQIQFSIAEGQNKQEEYTELAKKFEKISSTLLTSLIEETKKYL